MATSESLFRCENMYHVGAYRDAVDAARACDVDGDLSPAECEKRESLRLRARLALGEIDDVIASVDAMGTNAGPGARSCKVLAMYERAVRTGDESGRNALREDALASLEETSGTMDAWTRASNATVLAREGRYAEALRLCHGSSDLEVMAVAVSVLCAMDRPELAEKHARAMQQVDDDSTVAQLASAWASLASGGKKIQDASYIYQELGDKYAWTPKLYNASAVCSMMMGSYDDAERDLTEAVAMDPKNPETLANLATCALHLGKPSGRFINAIRTLEIPSESLTRVDDLEAYFDRASDAADV